MSLSTQGLTSALDLAKDGEGGSVNYDFHGPLHMLDMQDRREKMRRLDPRPWWLRLLVALIRRVA